MKKEITYCDRCGKETENSSTIELYKETYFLLWSRCYCRRKTEVCKECYESFQKWLEGNIEEDNDATKRE